jgi:hypothetical protein
MHQQEKGDAHFASLLDAMTLNQSRTWCFFKNFFVKYFRYLRTSLRVIHCSGQQQKPPYAPFESAVETQASVLLWRKVSVTNACAYLLDIEDSEVTVTLDLSRVIFTSSPRLPELYSCSCFGHDSVEEQKVQAAARTCLAVHFDAL